MPVHTVKRYHDFCAGHRVVGHESKCRHLHGHNYRMTFHVQVKPPAPFFNGQGVSEGQAITGLDNVGRVVDFSVVKSTLCQWLEDNWDHKFIAWEEDPVINALMNEPMYTDLMKNFGTQDDCDDLHDSIVKVSFNPTAENLAEYFVEVVAPKMLDPLGLELIGVDLEETRKCSVSYFK